MKTIYMTLSGIILSVVATIAIAGLVSISNLVKPADNQHEVKVTAQHAQIKMTQKEGLCHHKEEKAPKDISLCR